MYVFRFFRAIDDPDACEKFKEGHVKILTDYGVTSVATKEDLWDEDPDVFVITAQDEEGDVVGGIRLARTYGEKPLPIEDALGKMDDKIYKYLSSDSPRGTAEICGLWNAKRVFGKGVSPLLARTAVAFAAQIEIESLYCLVAPYTLDLARSIGFTVLEDLGDEGKFEYPNEKFISSALRIHDLETLSTALPEQRKRIMNLRRKPNQTFVEHSQKKNVMIAYQNDYKVPVGKAKIK